MIVAVFRIPSVFVAASLLALPFPELNEPTRRLGQAPTTLTGVVGHWSGAVTSSTGLVVDGAQWDGKTSVASLEQTSRELFGAVDSAFVAGWSSANAFPVAVASNVAHFTSGTLRVRFSMLGGASDQNAGALFGLRPNGEYHYVRYNTKDGNVALWRFVKGARELVAGGEVHKQLPLRSWHELVVTIRDNHVHGSIVGDTTIAIRHTLDAAPMGRVGVWVKRDAMTAFRDFDATPARSVPADRLGQLLLTPPLLDGHNDLLIHYLGADRRSLGNVTQYDSRQRTTGQVDTPRMRAGHLGATIFAVGINDTTNGRNCRVNVAVA